MGIAGVMVSMLGTRLHHMRQIHLQGKLLSWVCVALLYTSAIDTPIDVDNTLVAQWCYEAGLLAEFGGNRTLELDLQLSAICKICTRAQAR